MTLPKRQILRFVLALALLLNSNDLYSQNITLDGLISICNKDVDDAQAFLSSKGWQFYDSRLAGDSLDERVAWAYDLISPDQALAFLYLAKPKSANRYVVLEVFNVRVFNAMRERAINYKMRKIDSDAGEGYTSTIPPLIEDLGLGFIAYI